MTSYNLLSSDKPHWTLISFLLGLEVSRPNMSNLCGEIFGDQLLVVLEVVAHVQKKWLIGS